VVALGVLTIALAGAITLIIQVVNMAVNATNTTTANALLQQQTSHAISTICGSCMGANTNVSLALGGTEATVELNTETDEEEVGGGQSGRKFTMNAYSDTYTITTYIIDSGFSLTSEENTSIVIDSTKFYKIICKVEWEYKKVPYKIKQIEYARR